MTGNIAAYFPKLYRGNNIVLLLRNTLCFAFCLFLPHFVFSQSTADTAADYDQISVSLEVKDIGISDIPAIYHNKEVYLSVASVFDLIKIRNKFSPSYDSVRGFFLNEQDTFLIDKTTSSIQYQGKVINLIPGELLRVESNLYLNLKYFKSVFGLDGTFYFRRLVVSMSSANELPAIREMRQELMRKNLNRLKGDVKADTVVDRTYPFFHLGMADWAVMSAQQSEGPNQTTLNLGLGAVLAGGELNTSFNYYTQQAFNEKLQYYQWRFVNNDNPLLRQVVAGKIFTQATASLYAPVVGVQFTNAPTIYRKSYGTYTLSQTTEPNWIVELYVNDVLVDYKKSDASGFFTFEVPLIYGYTIIKLRFYGPYGEERTSMQYINIPFNFLPAHEFEYAVSGGVVEDGVNSRFSRVSLNYGVSSFMTVGGGMEYLSSVTSGTTMPFINTSLRLAPRLLVSGEYTYSVRSRGILSYRLPSGLQFDLDYTKYAKGQTAIYYNYLEERKAVVSMPIHGTSFALFTRLTLDQITVPTTTYTNAEWAITGSVKGVGMNLTTYASFVQQTTPYLYSIFSISFPLPKKIMFTGQMQYDYLSGSPVFMKYTFEKRMLGNGFFNIAYQEYFNANNRNILIGMRYDFSFARVAVSALTGNNGYYSRVEAASGSLIYDHKTNYLNANNRTNVGKGGIVIEPFLDLNCNGLHDPGEPKAPGLKIRINGGRILYNDDDTLIRILDLEPYNQYFMELNSNSFDNISWQIKKRTMTVIVNPNNFTVIEVPVAVVGEATGVVTNKNGGSQKGLGQIIVSIYNKDSTLAGRTLTESDGFFSYIGLAPGDYIAQIDPGQLHKLNLKSTPAFIPVHIAVSRDGDIADGLEFKLQPLVKDTVTMIEHTTGPAIDTASAIPKQEKIIAKKGSFVIQVGIFRSLGSAKEIQSRILKDLKLNSIIIKKENAFMVDVTGFAKQNDAKIYLPELIYEGYSQSVIVRLNEAIMEQE